MHANPIIKDNQTFMASAMQNYQNPQCVSLEEFNEDLNRIITIKKAITRYKNGEEINIRLMLNQFVVLFNVFGQTALDMLKFKIDTENQPAVFAFVAALNRLPDDGYILDQLIVEKIKSEIS